MKTIKVSEATPIQLDWLVAKCETKTRGVHVGYLEVETFLMNHKAGDFNYSTDWAQGGPIIERERVDIFSVRNGNGWCAQSDVRVYNGYGPTPLIAAMRCHVSSKLGDEVEVPEEL